MIHRILCAALCIASVGTAQSVIVVDDSGGVGVDFIDVQDAIDASVAGDIILLRPGTYERFTIDGKGISIQADGPEVSMVGPLTIRNIPAQESLLLRGFDIENMIQQGFPNFERAALLIEDCAGPVWVEGLRTNTVLNQFPFFFNVTNFGTVVERCNSAMFARCELTVTGYDTNLGFDSPGLSILDSNVSLFDCLVRGGEDHTVAPQNFSGANGIEIEGGTLFLSGCEVIGGSGLDGHIAGTMCEFCGGGDAGPGLRLLAGNPSVTVLDTTITAGTSGLAGSCFMTPCDTGGGSLDIEVQSGAIDQAAGIARRMTLNSPVRDGEVLTETWIGEPGDLVLLVFSGAQSPGYELPGIVGTNVLGIPYFLRLKGFIGPTGVKTQNIPIQNVVPALSGVPLYMQSFFVDGSSNIFSGGPSVSVLLDDLL